MKESIPRTVSPQFTMTCEVSTFIKGGDMALDMRGWDRETGGEEEEVILSDSHPGIHSKETQVKELFVQVVNLRHVHQS